jgi:hypothetical protein
MGEDDLLADLRPRIFTWRRLLVAALVLALPVGAGVHAWWRMLRMPGDSFSGSLPALSDSQRACARELRADVETLSALGEKSLRRPIALAAAADFIVERLVHAGHEPRRLGYDVRGARVENIEVALPAADIARPILVVGAHYDTARGSPGANDNGSGVAALLALARRFDADHPLPRPVRLVAFTNEEMPHFATESMGSRRYADALVDEGVEVRAMLSLETMGSYDDAPRSQRFPEPLSLFYPDRGDFIAFVGDEGSSAFVRQCVGLFREHAEFPSEGGALPANMPGVGWSDHRSFWSHDVPALMVTDTAPFRYSHYHRATDTPGRVDYERLARVVDGLEAVIRGLAR